jgi:hypothetical protein
LKVGIDFRRLAPVYGIGDQQAFVIVGEEHIMSGTLVSCF